MNTPGGGEQDRKPEDQLVHINLKVKGQDGNKVFYRIKRTSALGKLMDAYCERVSVDFNDIEFLFDGRRLCAEQTPDEYKMKHDDKIDAILHQPRGFRMTTLGGGEEDKKPEDQLGYINLKVKKQDGKKVFYRMRRTSALSKLMDAYCEHVSVDFYDIDFLFGGRMLCAEQTPDEYEMKHDDEIDAILHQTRQFSTGMSASRIFAFH